MMRQDGRTGRATFVLASLALVTFAGACSSGSPGGGSGATTTGPATTTAAGSGTAATVWLCRPGVPPDPCAADRNATVVAANGARAPQAAPSAAPARFDCFYVYPTVSTEQTTNADLTLQPAEVNAAILQVSRFSSVCNVWAPMYRQRTVSSLFSGLGSAPAADAVAYESVLAAWRDYLAHDNDGRPFILIGHSQGAAMLVRLVRAEIDPRPTLRKQLVSAIILGGNVQVPDGADVGGAFAHIPACRSASQTGCVIAYSSFLTTPPAGALFGRPGQGVSLQSDQTATTGQQVLCTNPAALSGGSGALLPYLTAVGPGTVNGVPETHWLEYPGMYRASCESGGGATWLQVTFAGGPADVRPRFRQTLGPTWGLHLDDVNLALGNLVADVASEEAAYH